MKKKAGGDRKDSHADMYRVFFEYAKLPMLLVEEDTIITLCNRAFEEMSGYDSESVQGNMSWTVLVADPEQLKKMIAYHHQRRINSTGVPEEYGFRMVDSNGGFKDVILSIIMIPETKQSLAFLQDITERNQSETWYKAIFENTGLPSIIIDPDTTIIKANTEWAKLSGYSIEENEGKLCWTSFVNNDDLERMRNYHKSRRADPSQAPRKYEFRFLRKNGEVRHMINSVTMIPGSRYSIASLMDLTELKEAEKEREMLEEQLQQARKLESIGQLAGGVAHDFNNMLAAILGYSEMAQIKTQKLHTSLNKMRKAFVPVLESGAGAESLLTSAQSCLSALETDIARSHSAEAMLTQVIKASHRAGDLTKQLLAFARKQTLSIKPISINDTIVGFEKMLRRTIRENIEIIIQLGSDLQFAAADSGQVEQIILNLALNAQDAMPDGGRLFIKTENKVLDEEYAKIHAGVTPGPFVMIQISDTGMGMDRDTERRIFEPFFTTKEQGKGTGLGLATVYGIVKQHMGSIWVYSETGKGTVFHIYLPQSDESPEECFETVEEVRTTGCETILVVEDQEQVRTMTVTMLREQGYHVIDAENGHNAIELAHLFDADIHLLVSDVVLPGMNGREMYDELLSFRPGLKALFISGYPMEIISHHGILEQGFNFMSKPVHLGDFKKKVREILDRKQVPY